MKILLLGKNGQVGHALQTTLAPLGELVALDRHAEDLCGDLSNLPGLAQTVRIVQPDVIVNAAAYTAVDRAESEPLVARTINALAPGILAEEARKLNALFVHYSTDYVFDGSGVRPWSEEDMTAPLNVYGQTKRDGEVAIQLADCHYLIFRTSWVHGAQGGNFIRSMLRLGGEREQLNVVSDQIGAPTSARQLAAMTVKAIERVSVGRMKCGLYHCAASGHTSWYDYAQFVFALARVAGKSLALKQLNAVPTSAYPSAARRPFNSRLCCDKLAAALSEDMPEWQAGVAETLYAILTENKT